jgi:hypothetical protein
MSPTSCLAAPPRDDKILLNYAPFHSFCQTSGG